MAISITVTQVRRVAATGKIYVRFADETILEFANFQAVKEWAQELEADVDQGKALLRKLFARWYVLHDPTGATPSLVEGHSLTLDLSAATNLLVVT